MHCVWRQHCKFSPNHVKTLHWSNLRYAYTNIIFIFIYCHKIHKILMIYVLFTPFFPISGAHSGIPEAPVQPDSWCQESKQARGEETLGLIFYIFLNRPRRPFHLYHISTWYPLVSMPRPCCQSCQVSKNMLSPCCPVSCHCQGHGLFGASHATMPLFS